MGQLTWQTGDRKLLEPILLVITGGNAQKTKMYLNRIRKEQTTGNVNLDEALLHLVEVARDNK